ncbi:hypothetical protein Tco_0601547 [Tanacetum coccineum]
MSTATATKDLSSSELAEEQVKPPSAAECQEKEQGGLLGHKFEEEVEEMLVCASYTTESEKDNQSPIKLLLYLWFMPDDDLASMTGFETQNSADHVSEVGIETLHASADKPARSDSLSHLHEELCLLHNKLPGLLADALKDTLPQSIKASIKSSILESIAKELPQKELSESLHKKMRKFIRLKVRKGMKEVRDKLSFCASTVDTNSQHVQDIRIMFKDMVSLLEAADVFKKANAEGEKWEKNNPESLVEEKDAQHPNQTKGEQNSGATTIAIIHGEQPSAQDVPNAGQAPSVNEEKALVLHTLEEKSSEEDTLGKKETDDEPPAKKLKATKAIMAFIEERGSISKISSLKSFVILKGPLSQEKVMAQLKEMKRLADLKAEKEKSEKYLKKILNPATIRAQT